MLEEDCHNPWCDDDSRDSLQLGCPVCGIIRTLTKTYWLVMKEIQEDFREWRSL